MSLAGNSGPASTGGRTVPARHRLSRYPLHLTILRFAVLLVLITAAGIGIPTCYNTRGAVTRLSNDLVHELAQQTEGKTHDFLELARPALKLSQETLPQEPEFGLQADRPPTTSEWKARARLFLHILRANREFNRVYLGDRWGDFTSAFQGSDGRLEIDHRWISPGGPHREVYQTGPDDRWIPVPAQAGAFDPRQRPWYKSAEHSKDRTEPIWTEPYLFATSKQPGITAALALPDSRGGILGVCGVDYELHDLDTFVGTLSPGQSVRVFIFAGNAGEGGVVAQAGRAPLRIGPGEGGANLQLPPAGQSPDPVVKATAAWLAKQGAHAATGGGLAETEIAAGGTRYFAAVSPLQARNLRWTTVIAVPEDEILGVVRKNSALTVLWCIAAVLLAGVFGYFNSLQVSRPLRAFAGEMKRVQNLEFSDEPSPPSSIDEVHEMGLSLDAMKVGLRAFEKYVPTDLVRTLLKSGHDPVLGGKGAPLTVMFADIVGFTSLSETMPPKELVDALAVYLEEMEKTVWQHEGIVDKYIGDAVMALWNTPIRPRDAAARCACVAALTCIQRLEELRAERAARALPFFTLNIGIHTGEALVGNIGSLRRFNYTAIGDTVNLTSRLEALNRVYGTRILISESTYRAVEGEFEVRLIDFVAVKGRKTPFHIYELLANRGELSSALRPMLAAYAEGLRRYQERDWQGALEKFTEASRIGSQPDPPSLLFIERCKEYLASPPPEDWDCEFVFTKK